MYVFTSVSAIQHVTRKCALTFKIQEQSFLFFKAHSVQPCLQIQFPPYEGDCRL